MYSTDGQALVEARKHKERTYPELCHGNGRTRLVVIPGGRRQMSPRKPRISFSVWQVRRPLVFLEDFTGAHEQHGTTLESSSGLFRGRQSFRRWECERVAWSWGPGAIRQ